MRIPVQALPTEAPGSLPSPRTSVAVGRQDTSSGLRGLAQGITSAGQAVGQAVQRAERDYRREADEARQKAVVAQTAEAEAQLQQRLITRLEGDAANARTFDVGLAPSGEPLSFSETTLQGPKGFLQSRGADASRLSAETLEALERDREEIARTLSTPEAQQMFRARTHGMAASARREVERHVASENQVALEASVRNLQDESLRKLAAEPLGEDVGRLLAQPEGPTAALALPGQGEAKVQEWRAKAAAVRLDALLGRGDWQGAQVVLTEAKDVLPPKAREQAEKDLARVRIDREAERYAALAVASTADTLTSRANREGAMAQVEKAPEDIRDEVAKRVEHLLGQAEKAWTQGVSERAAPAWTVLVKTHSLAGVDSRTKQWLQDNAAEVWAKLEDREAQYRGRERAAAAGGRVGAGQATAEELAALAEFEADAVENPDKYADMTAEQFITTWAPRLADRDMRHAIKVFSGTKDNDRVSASAFGAYVKEKKAAIRGKKDQVDFSSAMGRRHRAFVEDKKRQPSPDELEAMRVSATTEVVQKGLIYDSRMPAYQAEVKDEKKGLPARPIRTGKVRVRSPKGREYNVDEAGLDEWLKSHPGWTR